MAFNIWGAFNEYSTGGDVSVDTIVPTLTITTNDSNITTGETATLTFTFSEVIAGFDVGDVSVTNGTIGAFSGAGGVYTTTFTPTPEFDGLSDITVNDNSYTDTSGNDGMGDSLSITVYTITPDTTAPTLSVSSDKLTLGIGETADVTFTFSEAVTGFGIDDVVATPGAISGFSGSGALYTVTYTPPTNASSIVNVSVADNSYTNTNGDGGVGDSIAIIINTSLPVDSITVAKGAHKTITNQEASVYARRVYVGDVEAYSINVSEWSSGETITSTGILCEDGGVIVGYNNEVNGLISVLVKGASVGGANVIFDYSTATRNTCTKMTIKVVNSC